MSGSKTPHQSNQNSIEYKVKKEKACFDVGDSTNAESKTIEILSTSKLLSAVGKVWDRVKEIPDYDNNDSRVTSRNSVTLADIDAEGVRLEILNDIDGSYIGDDVRNHCGVVHSVQQKLEFVSVAQKISMFKPCSNSYTRKYPNETWNQKRFPGLGMLYDMKRIYEGKEVIPQSQYHVDLAEKTNEISNSKGCSSSDATNDGNSFSLQSSELHCHSFKPKDVSWNDNAKMMETEIVSSLFSDYCLGAHPDNIDISGVSREASSSLHVDYHIKMLVPHRRIHGKSLADDNNTLNKDSRKQPHSYVIDETKATDIRSSEYDRPIHGLVKQEHAYAGAFAGTFVSLCLHPVDTIKTVTQSSRTEQKSVCNVGRSILSERGVTGLYRGISSNIASSAPISAIYTFTYESVKVSLLPLFSKEYHSLAHCIAGGSASVATSFVFTPSERIKQQMQIGSHYHNCWNAMIGIMSNGGLRSLYTGWGAVLCRNVPHSVIKFYTYESLKRLILPSQSVSAQPNTIQTLVCGGLAGSTAALFTTPFDVVKTRLQTQIPGSVSQYNSVFCALKDIGKKEGLKGLYRGLIPRLAMYVSQGALFFASYEFFKRLFSLEVSHFVDQRIQYTEHMEDH